MDGVERCGTCEACGLCGEPGPGGRGPLGKGPEGVSGDMAFARQGKTGWNWGPGGFCPGLEKHTVLSLGGLGKAGEEQPGTKKREESDSLSLLPSHHLSRALAFLLSLFSWDPETKGPEEVSSPITTQKK